MPVLAGMARGPGDCRRVPGQKYRASADTGGIMSQLVTHRDPRYFEDPEEFKPDRWEDESATGLPRYAYYPFGGGQRRCIGSAFAMTEATLVLATVTRNYRLNTDSN